MFLTGLALLMRGRHAPSYIYVSRTPSYNIVTDIYYYYYIMEHWYSKADEIAPEAHRTSSAYTKPNTAHVFNRLLIY